MAWSLSNKFKCMMMNTRFFIVAGMLFICASCTNNKINPPVPAEKKMEFYYYPKTNMYYDVTNKKYLYSLDSSKTWLSENNESGNIPATLGNKHVIYSNTDSIWMYNAEHRKTYKGRLYHIIKVNNDLPSSYKDAREKKRSLKSTTKKTSDKQTDSAAPKKGIRGFFNRLFGKHKKK